MIIGICLTKEQKRNPRTNTGGKPSPSPEYPQEIVSAGEGGSIEIEVAGSNLLKPNNYNVFCEFPLEANTVVTLMTNGKASMWQY